MLPAAHIMSFTIRPARQVASITPVQLQQHLSVSPVHPLHISGLVSSWPALTQWRLSDGLRGVRDAVGEDRAVEIELGKQGRGYLHPDWQRVNMGFDLFLDAFIFDKIPSSVPKSQLPSAYLAQSDLLDSSSRLAEAVPPLPHFFVGKEKSLYRRTIWIGPEKSFTPFHKDPYVGIYSQIVGKKTFHVLPPEAAQFLSPSNLARHTNTSQIPIPVSRILPTTPDSIPDRKDLVDLPQGILDTCYTQLKKAFALEGACAVDLNEGESVLVPEGWWHTAEGGNEPGVGVGAWFR
ncbi:uncharacterized protein I206_104073 [Kwoniella pini CBS 10737]|uniref:JmjC domain-containing protein n=1 Tax=Kwoniella pini CBS 10737 TaxID=1296096 RepID=A0A1B9I2T2_9TREE|nr:uncharacterized protein I206_04351 [Kwoniella pini CBS 10737]OCF49824.1 hypothetical protein I206_04351 [Kwoniella pini CBS 10737]